MNSKINNLSVTNTEVEINNKLEKSDFSLGMNCGTDRKTSTTTKTNATDVLFTYHIVDGDSAAPLQISSINITDVEIFDRAGNSLKTPVISGSCQLSSSNENAINIKTIIKYIFRKSIIIQDH